MNYPYGVRQRPNYLFIGGVSTHDVRVGQPQRMLAEIDRAPGEQLLNSNVDDLIKSFVGAHVVVIPTLLEDEIHQSEAQEVDVPMRPSPLFEDRSPPQMMKGTRVQIHLPFSGDPGVFRVQPRTCSTQPPAPEIRGNELIFVFTGTPLNGEKVRAEFDSQVLEIKDHLQRIERDLTGLTPDLERVARARIEERRAKLLADKGVGQSIGFPMKRREGAAATYRAPEVRRKLAPKAPATTPGRFKPEPALDEAEYEHILGIMRGMVHVMERSPKNFHALDEEGIRSHFLVQLNGQYEGQASGETFNYEGKTDILIRSGDRNIFVAECKFWSGPAKLIETIDQLLGYLTWRDSKAAVVLFNRNKDFSKVLAAIPSTVKAHEKFRKEVGRRGDSEFRYVFRHKDDDAKDLHLTLLAFDIPSSAA